MLNMLAGWLGIKKVWDLVDGYKTYLSAGLKALTAVVALLTELKGPVAAHDAGAVFHFLQALSHDPNWAALLDAGLALGIGHKIDKAAASVSPPAA